MAGSIFALFDDIASLTKVVAKTAATSLDDAALATKKAAGVVVDDAAVVPQYAHGVDPKRELPMVGKMALGSLVNKIILVPAAISASIFAPTLVPVALGCGAAFLCFEGVESAIEKWIPKKFKKKFGLMHEHSELEEESHDSKSDSKLSPEEYESKKVKSAIKTDFILSAEIIVIALGSVMGTPILQQAVAVSMAGLLVTVGVYGVVAGIVKMDDIGLALIEKGIKHDNELLKKVGKGLVDFMPKLMKGLSHLGTFAMLAVGGGIFSHYIPHLAPSIGHAMESVIHSFGSFSIIPEWGFGAAIGMAVGAVTIPVVEKIISPTINKVSKMFKSIKNMFIDKEELVKENKKDKDKPEIEKTSDLKTESQLTNSNKENVSKVEDNIIVENKNITVVEAEEVNNISPYINPIFEKKSTVENKVTKPKIKR